MLSFINDYCEGACEPILHRLIETNFEKTPGYGEDEYTISAKAKIRAACGTPDADVYFLVGGTQTNRVVISSMLAPFEGVIAPETGHINVHEAGAIEDSGHKVLPLPQKDGKITSSQIDRYVRDFYDDANHEHMVYPGMVYISFPTEYGTIYSRAELEAISTVCREHRLVLYVDGARLGYGLACNECDLTLPELASLCDVLYIGGTKVGAFCGEAVVFTKGGAPRHFLTYTKTEGAMLAKGRFLGIQFDTLFTDDLYMKISRNAIDTAERLKEGLCSRGYTFFLDSPTNQIFIVIENEKMRELSEKVVFSFMEKYDDSHTVIRFVTSFATKMSDVDALIEIL